MSSRGLNAQRFTLPDSSEPNLRKGIYKGHAAVSSDATPKKIIEPSQLGTPHSAKDQKSPIVIGSWNRFSRFFGVTVGLLRCLLHAVGNTRAAFLITLPLVSTYLVQKFFPSIYMPKKLVGLLCAAMGMICSCALPDLFVPLSTINCNANYYQSLCVGQQHRTTTIEPTPTFLVSTTCLAPLPVTQSQIEDDSAIQIDSPLLPLESAPDRPDHSTSDFGLAKRGARILPALTSATEDLGPLSYLDGLIAVFRGYDKTQMHINPPRVVLEEQLFVSDCWKFAGSNGHIAIALSDTIFWKSFTVHFPNYPEIMGMRLRQAPKEIVMWALVLTDNIEHSDHCLQTGWEHFVTNSKLLDSSIFNASATLIEVARVTYKPTEGGHQMFLTDHPIRTSVIIVEILANWGDLSTCLHWLSFHGEKA